MRLSARGDPAARRVPRLPVAEGELEARVDRPVAPRAGGGRQLERAGVDERAAVEAVEADLVGAVSTLWDGGWEASPAAA